MTLLGGGFAMGHTNEEPSTMNMSLGELLNYLLVWNVVFDYFSSIEHVTARCDATRCYCFRPSESSHSTLCFLLFQMI